MARDHSSDFDNLRTTIGVEKSVQVEPRRERRENIPIAIEGNAIYLHRFTFARFDFFGGSSFSRCEPQHVSSFPSQQGKNFASPCLIAR